MRRPGPFLVVLSFAAFVSLGLPDTVLGVAWLKVREAFGLSSADTGVVLGFGVSGYFLSGLLAGRLVRSLGVGALLAASSGLVALGLVGYAVAPSWSLFFPIAALIGLGSGAIDSGLNAYAAHHFPVRYMSWLHASWSVGATIGPAIMTAGISMTGSYRPGYAILAAALGSMALAFSATRRSWDDPGDVADPAPASAAGDAATDPGVRAVLRRGRVWVHIAFFFVYTGVETGTGFWCATMLREARGLSVEAAGFWTAVFWGALTAGRVGLAFILDRFGPDRLLRVVTFTALAGIAAFAALPGLAGRLGLVVLGASLAPIFPTVMARTPARLGKEVTHHAVGFQVSAATLGSWVLPSGYGLLAAHAGVAVIPWALLGAMALLLALHEALLRGTPERAR